MAQIRHNNTLHIIIIYSKLKFSGFAFSPTFFSSGSFRKQAKARPPKIQTSFIDSVVGKFCQAGNVDVTMMSSKKDSLQVTSPTSLLA